MIDWLFLLEPRVVWVHLVLDVLNRGQHVCVCVCVCPEVGIVQQVSLEWSAERYALFLQVSFEQR